MKMKNTLDRIERFKYNLQWDHQLREVSRETAIEYFEYVLSVRDTIAGSLVSVYEQATGQTLTSEDHGFVALGRFILDNSKMRRVLNPLQELFWESRADKYIQNFDQISLNAIVALGLYISQQVKFHYGDAYELKILKVPKKHVIYQTPIIHYSRFLPTDPIQASYVTLLKAYETKEDPDFKMMIPGDHLSDENLMRS